MKCTVEMGSGAMRYIQRFHKDWFRHSKVVGAWIHDYTQSNVTL
jgi:hypothetical protein